MHCAKLLFVVLILSLNSLYSQYNRQFSDSEFRIKKWFDTLFIRNEVRYLLPDTLKLAYSDSISNELLYILQQENAFTYPFEMLDKMSKLTSSDSLVRIFTWNIKLTNNYFRYYGFILKRENKNSLKSTVFQLNDYSDSIPENELNFVVLTHKRWYGALYYQIVHYTHNKQNYYLLIGWDGYSSYINRKVVEVLYFNQRGKPLFGKAVFKSNDKTFKRLVFNHSIKASMVCRYDDKLKAIVFDHLVPSSPIYKDMYEFYGPNGTYDAYFLNKNFWIYKEDINIKNPPPKK